MLPLLILEFHKDGIIRAIGMSDGIGMKTIDTMIDVGIGTTMIEEIDMMMTDAIIILETTMKGIGSNIILYFRAKKDLKLTPTKIITIFDLLSKRL